MSIPKYLLQFGPRFCNSAVNGIDCALRWAGGNAACCGQITFRCTRNAARDRRVINYESLHIVAGTGSTAIRPNEGLHVKVKVKSMSVNCKEWLRLVAAGFTVVGLFGKLRNLQILCSKTT